MAVATYFCCFCQEIILPHNECVFIQGRGLHAHSSCQRYAMGESIEEPAAPPTRTKTAKRSAGKRAPRNAA